MRCTALFAALFASAGAVAAPVPKDVQTEERFCRQYGTRFDEQNRAKFVLTGDRLNIALVGFVEEPQDPFKPPRQPAMPIDSPRVLREVKGDFVARVGVRCPQPRTAPALGHGLVGGGLFVVLGEGHYFSIERYHCFRYGPCSVVEWDGSFDSYIRKLKPAASRGCFSSHRASIAPIPVRLTRRGDTFTAEASADGKKWEVIQTTKVTAPDKLLVGLFARNTLSDAAEVAFTDYTITKPE